MRRRLTRGEQAMAQLIRSVPILCAAGSIILAFGCVANPSEGEDTTIQESQGHTQIHTEDDCDPASWGALCNPNFHGGTTREEFSAELAATRTCLLYTSPSPRDS